MVDEIFEALSNPYRRQLLLSLLEHNPQEDDDRDPLNVISADTEPEVLETELVHSHLPKLEEMGFISRDERTDEISKGPNWSDTAPVLRLTDDHRDELPDDGL